jgi:hypothetical protein
MDWENGMMVAAMDGQMDGVSVVIPTYNRAGLIGATLDAILLQTSPPAEVIVVDDGSTDDTAAVLARYAPRVRRIVIPNSGDLAARNYGLRAARGRLVAFCDSDDLWQPDYLATMAALWKAEPRSRVAFGNFCIIRDDAWEGRDKFADAPPGYWDGLRPVGPGLGVFDAPVVARLLRFQPFFPSAMVADRQRLLESGGWDESVGRTIGTDFATALRLAEEPPIGVVQTPLVGIRKHAGNYSADTQAMNLGDAAILEQMLHARPSLAPFAAAILASILLRRSQALETAFARGDFAAVGRIFALLPAKGRSRKLVVKARIAGWPERLRKPVAGAMLLAGSLYARTGHGYQCHVRPDPTADGRCSRCKF